MTESVCFVTTYPPGRKEFGGGAWVDRRLLAALTNSDVPIDIITVTGPDGQWQENGYSGRSAGNVPLEVRDNRADLLRILLAMIFSRDPYLVKKFTSFAGWRQAVTLLKEQAGEKKVITSGWPALLLAAAAEVEISAHIAHNVEFLIAKEHSPLPLRLLGEHRRLHARELALLQLPKKVFTLSRTDAGCFQDLGISAEQLPLPLQVQSTKKSTRSTTIGFIGKASWPPNATALEMLLGPIHEELTNRNIEAKYVLAGRGTEAFLDHPRVSKAGWVDEEKDFYADIDLAVIPRFGTTTGISIKMIEAAEYGVPAITSPDVAMAVDPAGPWITATSPQEIVNAIESWSTGSAVPHASDWVAQHDINNTGAALRRAYLESEYK